MEEDDYYVDRYDCQSSTSATVLPSSKMVSTSSTAAASKLHHQLSSRQSSTESATGNIDDGPRSLEMDDVEGVTKGEGNEEEDYYEDDYDHLYVDTDGAEQYLREIWTQLGVGDNGYLNLGELYRVCEHIGMSASEEMIEQLFDKLDNDQDGRVSFVEFVDGLFKYVHKTAAISATARSINASGATSPVSVSRPSTAGEHQPNMMTKVSSSSTTVNLSQEGGSGSSLNNLTNIISNSTTSSPLHRVSSATSTASSVVSTSTVPNSGNTHDHHHHQHHHLLVNATNSMHDASASGFISFPTDKDG